jgi:hypothetical protein
MRLNRSGKPYQEPDQPKKCVIVDKGGLFYHPTPAPEGFCKCGVMLKLKTNPNEYIFAAHTHAIHAREHTIRWLKDNEFPFDPDDFIIKYV